MTAQEIKATFIKEVMEAINDDKSHRLLQLLNETEAISYLKKGDGSFVFHLLSYSVSKADAALARAVLQQEHLKQLFLELYLEGELANNFLSFIEILLSKIEDIENPELSLSVVKIIYDGFLIHSLDGEFPKTVQLTQSTYILYQNNLYFYDYSQQVLKKITVYEKSEGRLLDFFGTKPIDRDSLQRYLMEMHDISFNPSPEPLNASVSLNAAELSNNAYSAHPPLLIERPMNYQAFRDFSPTSDNFVFEYQKIKGKNQNAIISQVSQYLKLCNNTNLIPKIQDGICQALTHLFAKTPFEQWEKLTGRILQWNGTQEELDSTELKTHFELLVSFINKYQLGEKKNHSYSYLGSHLDLLLKTMREDSIFLINPWHQLVVKKGTDGGFLVYDPNATEGVIEERNINNVRILVNNSLGKHIVAFSNEALYLPEPTIEDSNAFIQEGALFFLFYRELSGLLSKLPEIQDVNATALKGLLLRNIDGIPLWAIPTNDKDLVTYMHSLVIAYMSSNANFKSELKQSLEGLSSNWLRRLGLDIFFGSSSDKIFLKKIKEFYELNPEKIAIHERIISMCNKCLDTIENTYDNPIILTAFYDLMHSFHHFTSRWDLINDDKILHLKNPILGIDFIIASSEEEPKHLYLRVIDKNHAEKKYSLPHNLQEPLQSISNELPLLFTKKTAYSTSYNIVGLLKEKPSKEKDIGKAEFSPTNDNNPN